MDLQLRNKVIVVTGGASGIGESIVRKLVDEDAIPCIVDRNKDALDNLSNKLKSADKKFLAIVADLTDDKACKHAIEIIKKEFGKIDGLINNAGLNDGVTLENGSYEKFIQSLKINAVHYYTMTELVADALAETKGAVVNICSKVAETGQGKTSGYAAANGVRLEITSAYAKELIKQGVRVNAVVVSECATPQYEWWINTQPNPEETLKKINAKIPLYNRRTLPEEVADTVTFLLSEKSGSINGEYFHVDGGYVHLDRSV